MILKTFTAEIVANAIKNLTIISKYKCEYTPSTAVTLAAEADEPVITLSSRFDAKREGKGK